MALFSKDDKKKSNGGSKRDPKPAPKSDPKPAPKSAIGPAEKSSPASVASTGKRHQSLRDSEGEAQLSEAHEVVLHEAGSGVA